MCPLHTPGDIASEKRIQSYTLWYTKMFVWSIPRSGYLPTLHLSNCSASRIFSRRDPSNTTLIPDLVIYLTLYQQVANDKQLKDESLGTTRNHQQLGLTSAGTAGDTRIRSRYNCKTRTNSELWLNGCHPIVVVDSQQNVTQMFIN